MTAHRYESPKPGFTITESLDAINVSVEGGEDITVRPRPKPHPKPSAVPPPGDDSAPERDKPAE